MTKKKTITPPKTMYGFYDEDGELRFRESLKDVLYELSDQGTTGAAVVVYKFDGKKKATISLS